MAGPGGAEVGRVAIRVLPDTSAFGRSLEKYLQRIEKTLRIEIPTEINTRGIEEDLERVKAQVKRQPATLTIQAETDEFSRRVRADVARLSKQIEAQIPITADGEELRRDLAAKIRGIEGTLNVKVPVDPSNATAFRQQVLDQVEEVQALVRADPIEVKVDVDRTATSHIARLTRDINGATTAGSALTTVTGQLATSSARVGAAVLLWGPPIVAALAAIVAIGPALAVLAPFTVGVGLGIGAIALSLEKLGAAFKPLVEGVKDLSGPISRILTSGIAPLVMAVTEKFLPVLKSGLSVLADVMNTTLKQLLSFISTGPGLRLIGAAFTAAGTALLPFLQSLKPLTRILLTLSVAAAPALTAMGEGFLAATRGFAKFLSAGLKTGELQRSISTAMSLLGTLLRATGDFLGPLVRGLAAIGPSVVNGVAAGFSAMGRGIQFINDNAGRIEPVFRAIGETATGVFTIAVDAVRVFVANLAPMAAALQRNQTLLKTLAVVAGGLLVAFGSPFVAVTAAIVGFIALFQRFGAQITAFLAPLIAGFRNLQVSLVGAFATVAPALNAFIGAILPLLLNIGRQIIGVVGPALASIGRIISQEVAPAFARFLPVVTPVAKFLITVLGGIVVGVLKGVINIIKGVLKVFAGLLNFIAGVFTGNWTLAWNGIKQIFSGVWTAIKGIIQVLWNIGIVKLFKLGFTAIKSLASAGWAGIKGLFSAGRDALGRLAGSAWTLVKTAFTRGILAVVKFTALLPGRLVAALGKLGGLLVQAGRNLIAGLLQGIRERAQDVVNYMGTLAGDAVSAIKSKLKISSPSRVMIEIGRYVSQGFAKGIAGSSDQVKSAMNTLVKKIQDATAGFRKAKTSISEKIDADRVRLDQARERYAAALRRAADGSKASLTSYRQAISNALAKLAKDKRAKKALESSFAGIADGLGPKVIAMVKSSTAKLSKLAKQRATVAEALAAAQEKLQEAIKVRDDYAASIRDAAVAFGSLIGAEAAEGKALTASDVVKNLQTKLQAILKFRANLDKLRASGLSDAALKQLTDAGVEAGGATADALAKGGPAVVAEVNNLIGSIGDQAQNMGTEAGQRFYQAGVDSAQGLVNGLLSQAEFLKQAAEKLIDDMVNAIKRKLKIKSPSRVGLGLGANFGAAVAGGLDSMQSTVSSAADRLVGNVTPASAFVDPAADDTAQRGSLTVNVTNPVPETASESVTRIMRSRALRPRAA